MSHLLSRSRRRLLFTITLFGPASVANAADPVLLKHKLDAPTEIYAEINSDIVQKMTGPDGKPMEITSRSLYGLLQTETPKAGALEIQATLDRLIGAMDFGNSVKSFYDSDDPDFEDASPMHKDTFGPILNMPLKLTLDSGGLVTALEGGEPIRKKLADMGEQNFVASSLLEADFTDAQIKSAFGETPFVLYPDRDVKIGDTWKNTRNDEYPHVGKTLITYDCKLDRVEILEPGIKRPGGPGGKTPPPSPDRLLAVVTFKGTISKNPDDKPAKDQRLGKIDGSFTGTATFDTQLGRFVEIRSETKANVEVAPWWTKEPEVPLMKIESLVTHTYTSAPASDRKAQKTQIAQRIADAQARREADEAAAMAGPVEPATAPNEPIPWLQWGGPDRNFNCAATGLANRWPENGPPCIWQRPLGDGFSAILADAEAVYTAYSIRDKDDPFKGDEVVTALDAKTGKTLWEHKYPAPWPKDLQMEFGPGPHSTPLIVGDKLFTIGCTAKLFCLDKKTGSPIWSKDLHEEFKAGLHMRGYGSSPLACDGNILLPVGKEKGHAIMAFAQSDGAVAWKGGDFEPGYASLLRINALGVDQLLAFTGSALLGVKPTTAETLWSVEHPTQWSANITTPVWNEGDNSIFISSAYGMGSRGIQLEKSGDKLTAKELWFNPKMKIQHADAVRQGEFIYGSSGDFGPTFLACLSAGTGEFAWRQRGIAKATLLLADKKLIVLDEEGALYLVKADPEKYRLLAKTTGLLKKTAWTVPTLVGRTLYLRDREKIIALDLGASHASS